MSADRSRQSAFRNTGASLRVAVSGKADVNKAYDLTMPGLTLLPVLIYDSSIVKRIEDSDFEQMLGLRRESGKAGKRVFIAFDKVDAYTPKPSGSLMKNKEMETYGGD